MKENELYAKLDLLRAQISLVKYDLRKIQGKRESTEDADSSFCKA